MTRQIVQGVLLAVATQAGVLAAQEPIPPAQEKPAVAVIGTGRFASALGPKLGELGYPVIYGSRTPERESVRELVARTGANASAASQLDAAARAQIIILAVPMEALEEVAENLGDLEGKVLVDVSGGPKRLAADGYLELASDSSNAERLQARHPKARVVRVSFPLITLFEDPLALGTPPTVPIAGDSASAKEAVARFTFEMGLDPWDAGPVRYARLLDALGLIWMTPLQQGRDAGVELKLLRNTTLPCFIDVKEGFGFGTPYDVERLAQFPERETPISCEEWRQRLGPIE
jgi:predicted dinucleotide-binding enzyme